MEKGLVLVYTGNGKGKTSAALGAVLRTLGCLGKVSYIQFMKGGLESSERKFFEKVDEIDVHLFGAGWYKNKGEKEKQLIKAQKGLACAKEAISSKKYDLIVLDEINYILSYELLQVTDVIELIENRGKANIILTGRNAKQEIIDFADTVSELKEIKHAFTKGYKAQKGIDY